MASASRLFASFFVLAPFGLLACAKPDAPPTPPPTGPRVVTVPAASATEAPSALPSSSVSSGPAVASSAPAYPAPTVPPPPQAVPNANAFALRLFGAVKKPDANVLASGTSVRQALAIVALGAKGDTAAEMSKSLSLSSSPDEIAAEGFAETTDFEKARGSAELRIANRLFPEKSYVFLDDFVRRAQSGFGGALENVDFRGDANGARRTINDWASERTAGKITELLPAGSVDANTRLVVADAVWLKAAFRSPFDVARTAPAPFAAPGRRIDVPTMHVTASLPFYDGKDVQVIELPYEQSSLAFVIVLPKSAAGKARKDGGLGEMEKKLDERWLSEQLGFATAARVDLALPKLSFAWSSELSAPLQALGIKQVFTTKANLSGLSKLAESQPLAITGVFHKTFLAVDERGTEAAAATGVVVGVKSAAPSKPVVVAVDHPFFFALRDRTSGRLLFTGHVVDPSLK